jgi:hypothetical protein
MDIAKEVKEEESLACAYCQSKFKSKAELSPCAFVSNSPVGPRIVARN